MNPKETQKKQQLNSPLDLERALKALNKAYSKLEKYENQNKEAIAIIGMGCRLPGGPSTPEAFWELLQNGVDAITEVPADRWPINKYYDSDPTAPGKMYTRYGGFIEGIQEFDANFFGISPKETVHLDPQQRLLLEVSWEALERSGINYQKLTGSSTGVFVGICSNDYTQKILNQGFEQIDAYIASGNSHSTASGRISYLLGLKGPSLAVDTACSSSLVSIHLATTSLRNRECNLALAGGVNALISPEFSINFSKARMLSADGRCKTFDATADGFVRGEGCGMVILKRFSDAVADGDNILAVIRGTAINQDGDTSGLTVPNGPSQQAVIGQALENGGVDPASISYIEAHGTGTSLGDPIEVGAIGTVFGKTHSQEQPVIIGSAKTNIGHLEGAAGIAGLMKVVLQLQNQKIAPSLHLNQPNPYINWDQLPVQVATKLTSWQTNAKSRIAGVSSFGFSGTNAHVVIEEAPSKVKIQNNVERPIHLLTLSGKTEKALEDLVSSYQNYLETNPELPLADICYTASTGRAHFNHRLGVIASEPKELMEKLLGWKTESELVGVFKGLPNSESPKIAFLFTGQGSQYINMGRQLYEQAPTFRQALEECAQILKPYLETSILEIIHPEAPENSSTLDQTAYTQPAIFALEYALFKLWSTWGIKPNVVMGHSVGEYVAACIAGVFSLEDGLKLIAMRGKLMQKLPSGGEMVSVMASESQVTEAIKEYTSQVTIAAVNGPESIVISGESGAITNICNFFELEGVKTKQLQVSHAFHSPLMEPMLTEFEAVAKEITYNQPKIPLISNVTGTEVGAEITTAEYWVGHVRQPVKFAQSMKTLEEQGYESFLEIGPKPILLSMGRQCVTEDMGEWLPSLRPGVDEWQQMLSSLGKLYVQGAKIDWSGFDSDYSRQKVALPTYPFQRERYWVETTENKQKQHQNTDNIQQTPIFQLLTQGNTETLTQQLETTGKLSSEKLKLLPELLEILAQQHQEQLTAATIKNWFYEIQWRPLTQTNSNTNIQPSHWLILADTTGVAEKLAQKLQQQGHEYSLVYRGENYQKPTANTYQLNPHIPQEFEQLYQEIQQNTQTPITTLIHLWSLDAPDSKDLTLETLESSQIWGCGSVVHLLQTLLKNPRVPELWLITRGSQSVLSNTENQITGLAASPLWGLGRVVSNEHPQLWGGLIDLDPQSPAADETEMLWQLLVNQQEEDHLALRGKNTYVARLVDKDTPEFAQPLSLSSDGSYLITGGLGALGLHTAQWLVEKGAKNIVLTGRRPPTEKVTESLKQLEEKGCQVRVLLGDVAVEAELEKILEQIQTSMPTLKGIIQSAGVLDDGTIQQMNWERFAKVMSPKVIGTWHLHKLTQNLPLDFFVCFSSIASMLGSLGQGNYAAANAFMDALASYRRSQGLSGLAINWGAWASEGMAARLAVEHQNRMHNSGITEIAPKEGKYALDLLLTKKSATAQVGVAGIQWQVLAESWSGIKINSLLRELLQQEEWLEQDTRKQKVKGEFLAKLEEASNEKRQEILIEYIRGEVAQVLGFSSSKLPEVNVGLMEMGMDSLMTVELKNRLQNQLGTKLPETIAIEYPTIAKLSLYIEELMGWNTTESDPSSEETETQLMMERSRSEAIAIIGIGCRFPGNANTPESFWELLSNGKDSITEIPLERWDLDSYYDPNPDTPGKMYIRHAALVEKVDQFDPRFFGISNREAYSLDPQQRFILEVTWEALERAGINPQQLENTQTGVFLGIGQNDYANLGFHQAAEDISPYDATGNLFCFVAGRLSYFLGTQGPSMAIDTACSSSLVAIHEACESLRQGESNLALAGGVQLILSPEVTTALSRLKALAPDGKCKTFDAAADGFGRGEGCGIVVLKRLSDALKDGDRISAVIPGSAVNHDGPSSGMTVPNKLAQEKLIQKALKAAKVKPLQVSYVEAHGTGTSLGDPMEVRALARVFEEGRDQENPLNIGSVKTNIGHLEAAAGIAGMIKVILQLQHQKIVPHLHFANPNPYIDWENMPLKVPTQLTPWLSKGEKRMAGVSSFGMSGTNAHIVLEEAPIEVRSQKSEVRSEEYLERPVHILTLSAKTEKALEDLVNSYESYLEAENNDNYLGDICYTTNIGRAKFDHRLAVVTSDKQELVEKLKQYKQGENVAGIFSGKQISETRTKIAFIFTGQGSQYLQMGRQLYETQPTFHKIIDQCSEMLVNSLEVSLLDILYPVEIKDESSTLIDQTAYTQPAIFALEYALAKLWESWGIKPDVVMGHSVGEYVAATVAGVFSLEDGLKLIAMRGQLMQKLPSGGQMASIMASESQVIEAIKEYSSQVTIAAVNGPESIVISGESPAIASICSQFESVGVKTKALQVSHAFHSPLMEPMLTEFETVATEITYNQPKIPLISNVTGQEVGGEITTAEYWVSHVRQPVRFAEGMETLHKQGAEIFLEIGSKPILLGMARECLMGEKKLWLPSLRSGKPDWLQILQSLAQLYVRGIKIDWLGFDQDYFRNKLELPTYPWQRKRYWRTDIRQRKSQDKKSITSEKKVQLDGVNIQLKEIQMNDKILQQPKLKLSDPESLYLSNAESTIEVPTKAVQVKPAADIESENITQLNSLDRDVTQIRETLKESLADALYADISEIEEDKKFVDLGLDSIVGVEWITNINKIYNLNIKATKVYDYPTLQYFSKYIAQILSTNSINIDVERSPSYSSEASISKQSQLTDTQSNFSQVKEILKQQLADALYADISEIEENKKFVDLGLDSIVGVEWITNINKTYNLNIKATKIYDYPTLLDFAKYINQEISSTGGSRFSTEHKESSQKDYLSGDSPEEMTQKLRSILKKVANKELTVQEGNKMIQQIKNKLK
ncbi:MAG: SDR family NAD(P)-dependent oxidoreductase [Okeania sp. SIO3B5]|uniref:type I polyketide synthase n=1 Tax=Okeania sp. SIO3B5 TaxID=2607811 RepID=UPI0013FF06FF|nr:type I polyketide synthase [Okeania sp. SIO3B5]NEO53136.1 SDR family NAD(P)-dependent oxidoreductase [Okeania sp. SIO3B5]